jgi:hypothetical protein
MSQFIAGRGYSTGPLFLFSSLQPHVAVPTHEQAGNPPSPNVPAHTALGRLSPAAKGF